MAQKSLLGTKHLQMIEVKINSINLFTEDFHEHDNWIEITKKYPEIEIDHIKKLYKKNKIPYQKMIINQNDKEWESNIAYMLKLGSDIVSQGFSDSIKSYPHDEISKNHYNNALKNDFARKVPLFNWCLPVCGKIELIDINCESYEFINICHKYFIEIGIIIYNNDKKLISIINGPNQLMEEKLKQAFERYIE